MRFSFNYFAFIFSRFQAYITLFFPVTKWFNYLIKTLQVFDLPDDFSFAHYYEMYLNLLLFPKFNKLSFFYPSSLPHFSFLIKLGSQITQLNKKRSLSYLPGSCLKNHATQCQPITSCLTLHEYPQQVSRCAYGGTGKHASVIIRVVVGRDRSRRHRCEDSVWEWRIYYGPKYIGWALFRLGDSHLHQLLRALSMLFIGSS